MADREPVAARSRPSWGTVRLRTTLGAVAVVGVALLAASIALVTLLGAALTDEVEAAARLRAEEVAATVAASPSTPLTVPDAEEQMIQVVDGNGAVVASSANVTGWPPVAAVPAGGSTVTRLDLDDGDEFVIAAATADIPGEPLLVLVGRGLEEVSESTGAVRRLLALGVPLLLAVVAVTTWWVVGRALAPVEAIRTQVDAISSAQLHRRVPEPHRGDEISRLAQTMNRMLHRLQSSQLRQRRFVSDASHELRSPVAGIRQHAEVAAAHPERTSVEALAAAVLAEDLRIQRLLEDLLVLARSDEGGWSSPRRPVDLDDLVLDEARRAQESSPVQVDASAVSAGRVVGDPVLLRRMVGNLVDNAAHHAGSRITLGLGERDGLVTLTVDDDGAGIAPADRERIFERFVRLDEARARHHGGAGLGLAIVSEVVAGHGGTVTVTEAPAGGARFEVRLPRLAD